MLEFYLAPRTTYKQLSFLIDNYDKFLILKKELGLPDIGFLMVPRDDYTRLSNEYSDIPFALDNGAFQFLKLDFDSKLYLNESAVNTWLNSFCRAYTKGNWKWSALLDVPVHGKKFVERDERLRRIRLTYELHKKALERCGYDKRLRLVLQGYTVDEYHLSYRYYIENFDVEKLNDVLAVGSVCVRKDSSLTKLASGKARGKINDFMDRLLNSNELYKRHFIGLHFFGLHGRFVKKWKDHRRFYSSDSGAGGSVFRYEIKDIMKKMGYWTDDQNERYLIAQLVQYVRSTRGMDRKAWNVLRSLF